MQAGPQPYTQNYPPYGRPPIQYPDYGGYVLNDLPPLGYGSLPGPAGRANDYERYNPSRTNTIKSEPNVNRVKRGKLNFLRVHKLSISSSSSKSTLSRDLCLLVEKSKNLLPEWSCSCNEIKIFHSRY